MKIYVEEIVVRGQPAESLVAGAREITPFVNKELAKFGKVLRSKFETQILPVGIGDDLWMLDEGPKRYSRIPGEPERESRPPETRTRYLVLDIRWVVDQNGEHAVMDIISPATVATMGVKGDASQRVWYRKFLGDVDNVP